MSALERTCVLVLAAGRGTRMGGPKALMTVGKGQGGRPWWTMQQLRLTTIGLPAVWVVSERVRVGMSEHNDVAAPNQITIVDETLPMFASIVAGLNICRDGSAPQSSSPEGVFVLPIDCPAPTAEVWRRLAETGVVAVPAFDGKGGHPVYLPWTFVTATIDKAIADASDLGGLRLDALIAPVARTIDVDDPTVTINLNTPGDVAVWLADETKGHPQERRS